MTGIEVEKKKQIGFGSWIRNLIDSPFFFGACVFLLSVLCLLTGLSKTPHLYPIDYGQFEQVLNQCGLTWTSEDIAAGDLQYSRPITAFAYKHFSWTNLLTPNVGNSIVYLAALVRLVTEPFGMDFPVDGLALVSAVLLLISVVLMSQGLRRLLPRVWFVPLIVFCIMVTNGNFFAMFRGFYPEGPSVVFTMLFAGVTLYAWSIQDEKRKNWIIPVIITSVLMLKADTPLLVFTPLVLVVDILLLFSCVKISGRDLILFFAAALLLISGISSAFVHWKSDSDYFSDSAIYESVFNTMLPAAENPKLLLIEFGLDESYAEDIGKSFYMPEESYSYNPRDPETADFLFSRISFLDIFQMNYLHPDLLSKVIRELPASLNNGFESSRNRVASGTETGFKASRTENGLLLTLWQFFPHSYALFFWIQILLSLVGVLTAFFRKNRYWLWVSLIGICSIAYLPFTVALNGYSLAQQYILYQVFLTLILWGEILMGIISGIPLCKQWLTVYTNDPYHMDPVTAPESPTGIMFPFFSKILRKIVNYVSGSRWRVTVFTSVMSLLMLLLTFLVIDHPVCINNGDFGRMMAQLDLTWPGNIYFDAVEQMGHSAIEEYGYLRPWNILKLTPFKPTFSLYWFSSIVRLLTEPFGKPFSTWLLAWVMGIISVLCVVTIVYDIYPLLKKWTIIAAVLLCVMLYSETYLTWYDGLFGEGCILLGILMSLMCTIHLCTMSVKGKFIKKLFWLFGLFISLNIMVTAKSQMLLTLPGAVLLFIALNVYQRAYRYDVQALQGIACIGLCCVLVFSSFFVYESERTEESVSQKHTMWQAYFYGIFMISDDPIGDMEDLGVDTAMAPDIGKYVQFEDPSMYVYAPLSDEAQTAFYDHVSMFTILKWYLTHPTKLWYMMDHAAKEARSLYTGFRVYNGQNYSLDHDAVDGLNFWPGWRTYLTPVSFLGYVIFYSVLLFLIIRFLLKKSVPLKDKVLCTVPLFLIISGVIQYPMSVIGNGFVDNQKQMFGFSLCHDILLAGVIVLTFRWLYRKVDSFDILEKVSSIYKKTSALIRRKGIAK